MVEPYAKRGVPGDAGREDRRIRLIKYGHARVRLEKDSRALVIDPGMIMPDAAALAGAVHTCEGVARGLAEFGDRVRVVRDGDVVKAAGFEVAVDGRCSTRVTRSPWWTRPRCWCPGRRRG